MGSIRGYRCTSCRGELLATSEPAIRPARPTWTPPVLCCGQPLRPLDPAEILTAMLPYGRPWACPRCGYQVRIVVHPASPLVCMLCQIEYTLSTGAPRQAEAPVAAAGARS